VLESKHGAAVCTCRNQSACLLLELLHYLTASLHSQRGQPNLCAITAC
jgi:hypothetical protein